MIKPLIAESPYPKIDRCERDKHSVAVISPAYCGGHGELSAVLGYTYKNIHFKNLCEKATAELLMNIAMAEMMHFQMLGEMICSLGVDPIFTAYPPCVGNYFNTSHISYSFSPSRMISDAIVGEIMAIKQYQLMLDSLKNERVKNLIERIIQDEQLHLTALKQNFERQDAKVFY